MIIVPTPPVQVEVQPSPGVGVVQLSPAPTPLVTIPGVPVVELLPDLAPVAVAGATQPPSPLLAVVPPAQITIEQGSTAQNQRWETLPISAPATTFTLSTAPVLPHLSALYLNGIRALFGEDYLIDGVILRWLSPLPLASTDRLHITYYHQ